MAAKKDHWSSKAYSGAASFVPQLTTKVLQYLDPQPTDSILDIGCGDGVLDAKIAPLCKHIWGLDASRSFIEAAKQSVKSQHPNTDFLEVDCRRLSPDACETEDVALLAVLREGVYDKVFSNAAMHWILSDEHNRKAFFCDVNWLLKPGGAFVFEQGGFQNVPEVYVTLTSILRLKYGLSQDKVKEADPWFFPSTEWMRSTLEEAGFDVEVAELEHRPTKLNERQSDGSGGLEGWLRLMGANFLELLDEEQQDEAVKLASELLEPVVTKVEDRSQWLSYVRLRAVARKKS